MSHVTDILLEYTRAEIAARDNEAVHLAAARSQAKADGYRLINGGQIGKSDVSGYPIERYYDDETGEVLYHGPCRGGEKCHHLNHVRGIHVDYLGTDAFEASPSPEPPAGLPKFLVEAVCNADTDELLELLA